MFPNTQKRTDRVGSPYDSDPLTTPPQLKRKPAGQASTPYVAPPVQLNPNAGQPLTSLQRLANNARGNAHALGQGLLAVRDFMNAEPTRRPTPAAAPAPATAGQPSGSRAPTAGASIAAMPVFNQNAAQLRGRGASPQNRPDPPAAAGPSGAAGAGASAPPGIDSGVTLPDGRKLNYGAMVNGVPTFSDGSGGPGGIPATMSKQDIASLGDRLNTVPATSFTRPGAGVLADAAGAAPLSSAGAVNTLVRNAQGPKFGITPEMLAQSENNAVTSGDWRSAAGTAAHNLAVEAAAPSTYLQRTRALTDLSNLQANTARAGQQAVDNAATLQRTGIAGQNALDVANLQGQYGLADTRARALVDLANRRPDQVVLADGTLGLIQPSGTVTRAVGADGKPVQVPMTKLGGLTEKDISDQATQLLSRQPELFGLVNGQIFDPTTKQYRAPTAEERAAMVQQARAMVTGQTQRSAGASAPKVGDVVKGYRFKGGDPAQQSSWEKA